MLQKEIEPQVTVGIPYYKETKPDDLKLAIESILFQSFNEIIIHLIQDGNVDENLSSLIREYVKNHENIVLIKIAENKGLAYALNMSILNCNTKYYARMDSDDISHPDRIKKQYHFMESNSHIHILGSWINEFYDESILKIGPIHKNTNYDFITIKTPERKKNIANSFHYRNPICHVTVMFRKDIFAKIGLYNSNYRRTQDLELWSRALKTDIGITNLQEPLVYVRAVGFAEKRSNFRSVLRQAKIRYKYNTLSPKYNILKLAAIAFRLLPKRIQKWGYKNLRV
jgi:glycosyltransferase involved in cell wall biosynthesis